MAPRPNPPRDPAGVLDAWLDHLQVERGASPHTLAAYRGDVIRVLAACGLGEEDLRRDGALEALDEGRLMGWLRQARRDGRATSTVARRLVALRGYLRFARGLGACAGDPTQGLPTGKGWKRLPKVLSREAVAALLAAIPGDTALGIRDRALLELMYATGARVQEACDWQVTDVRPADRVIRCTGKGRKERWVPFGASAQDALAAWMDGPRATLDRLGDETLFLSRSGRPLDRHRVYRLLQERAAQAGLLQDCSPHTLRHSFATHVLAGGADLRVVQELLGHADVQTTQVYTHVDTSRLKQVHRRFHPRG